MPVLLYTPSPGPPALRPCPLPAPHPALQLVLTTDPTVGSMVQQLQYIYSALFVELVVKNPLYTPGDAFL